MKINSANINGIVSVPCSKSVLHRLIILASLSSHKTTIFCSDFGKDILATIDCMNKLGASITIYDKYIEVLPITKPNNNVTLMAGESGSTLRFLLPIVCALGVTCTFDGKDSLKQRPISDIVSFLRANNINVSRDKLPLTVSGKLSSGRYEIDGSLSSQFASGMLMALSIMGEKSYIKVNNVTSKNYIDITVNWLNYFGKNISFDGEFVVDSNKLVTNKLYICEGDWSSAFFIIALGILCGKTEIENLNFSSLQGDKIVVDIIKKMGGKIYAENNVLVAEKSNLKATVVDIKNYPDIAPMLAILMGSATGTSEMINVDRLKIKESDRLANIIQMLSLLGIKTKESNNKLIIYGGKMHSCKLQAKNDHRIALAGIVALTKVGGEILGEECMDKSYPNFLSDYKTLGGQYEL